MLIIRPYERMDHDAVYELHYAALQHAGADAGLGPWDDDLHHVEDVYQRQGGEFLVAEMDGVVVGMGALTHSGPGRGEIRRMRVAPSHQRRGIARRLLAELERRAAAFGYARLHLDTTTAQTAAQRLYLSAGYREVGRKHEGPFEVVLYEKRLPERPENHTGPTDALPEGAELLLTAEHVLRGKGTIRVGRVECSEVRPGDRVVAVGERPICRGVVSGVETFAQTLPVARRGDEVGVLVRGWGDFHLPVGVRLFRVRYGVRESAPGA
jgi:ribosomal protein S18 acetylase RimI-like enzyme